MFLSDGEKGARSEVLKGLLGKLTDMQKSRMSGDKAPVVAEVAVGEVEPVEGDDIGESMDEMTHDQVEAKEAELFPKEEALEAKSEISPEDKANLEALAAKYLR